MRIMIVVVAVGMLAFAVGSARTMARVLQFVAYFIGIGILVALNVFTYKRYKEAKDECEKLEEIYDEALDGIAEEIVAGEAEEEASMARIVDRVWRRQEDDGRNESGNDGKKLVVAIVGKMASGKDTLADALCMIDGAAREKLAAPMYEIAEAMREGDDDAASDVLERLGAGHLIEQVKALYRHTDSIEGSTKAKRPRMFLQGLGNMFREEGVPYVEDLVARIERSDGSIAVITDVRTHKEIEALKGAFGDRLIVLMVDTPDDVIIERVMKRDKVDRRLALTYLANAVEQGVPAEDVDVVVDGAAQIGDMVGSAFSALMPWLAKHGMHGATIDSKQ